MVKNLICVECGNEFAFSEDEKLIYERMGFAYTPKRCRICRGADKALKSASRPEKEMHTAICDACGKETQLPFKPKGDKPVYCRECFAIHRKAE